MAQFSDGIERQCTLKDIMKNIESMQQSLKQQMKEGESIVVGVGREATHHISPKQQRPPLQHAPRVFRNLDDPEGPPVNLGGIRPTG